MTTGFLLLLSMVQASTGPALAWTHDAVDTAGYTVTIDGGAPIDVGMAGCPSACRYVLPVLAPGPHTFKVTAYNDAFATPSDVLTRSVPQKPVNQQIVK